MSIWWIKSLFYHWFGTWIPIDHKAILNFRKSSSSISKPTLYECLSTWIKIRYFPSYLIRTSFKILSLSKIEILILQMIVFSWNKLSCLSWRNCSIDPNFLSMSSVFCKCRAIYLFSIKIVFDSKWGIQFYRQRFFFQFNSEMITKSI